jgi:outer membrane receptor protein involved in Fe transport
MLNPRNKENHRLRRRGFPLTENFAFAGSESRTTRVKLSTFARWKMGKGKRIIKEMISNELRLYNPLFSIFYFLFPIFFVFLCLASPIFAQTISGTVTDAENAPVQNAQVTLTSGNRKIVETQTNANGEFSFDGNERNDLILRVSAENFAVFEKRLADLTLPATIVLQPRNLRADVTISITQTETRLSETPASVVVLPRETLETTAAQTVDEQLRQIAGFQLFRRSSSKTTNPTAQGANFRGLAGSGAARSSVSLDGVSVNDAFGGWTYWSRIPRNAVEQIEVLRGGASALYGDAALSGAINFLTSEPQENEPILRLETSAGTQNTFDASFFGAYRKNDWTFDLAAESFKTGGYIPVTETERGAADAEADSRHNNVFLTVARRFGDAARIFARGNYFTENRRNGTVLQYNQTRFRQAAGGADFADEKIGAFQLRAFVEAQVYDQTFTAVSANRDTETLSRIQRVPSQAFGASLFWNRVFAAHAVAASFEFRQVRGFSNEIGFFGGRATSLSDSGGSERTFSVFAQDAWRATKNLTVNFGARYDRWENFGALNLIRTLAIRETLIVNFSDRNESAFSPRVAALYQFNRNFSFLASYAKSFRAPTLNELYRAFRVGSVSTLANENLRAERADTFEAGLNFTGFARKLNVRGNFFITAVKNPVVSVTILTNPSLITRQRRNVGETRSRGIEMDAEFTPRQDLRFSASYLMVDSIISDFPANANLMGKFLPQVPRQQLTFQTVYRPTNKFSFSLQGRISAAQFEDDLNTLRLRPFFTIDAFASYKIRKNLEIFTAIENVFNNRYDIGLTPNRTVAAPRFARVGLRFNLSEK